MRETNHFVFFWKGNDIFSNFYYTPFIHQGLKAKTPNMCKDLGRSRQTPFREDVW